MKQKTPRKVSKAQVRRIVDDGIKANDTVRVADLENLLSLRSKKANLQQREQRRLSEKYGSRHTRVQQLNKSMDANANYIGGLRMEVTRATTPVKKPDANAWCVHGHVYDTEGCPISNANVALYGTDQKRIKTVIAAKTNDKGYYQLDYTPGTGLTSGGQVLSESGQATLTQADSSDTSAAGGSETSAPDLAAGAQVRTGDEQAETGETQGLSSGLRINTNVDARASVFVRASYPKEPDICADSTLITPRSGVCSYRDISLNKNINKSTRCKDRRSTRYLGNSATRELHDLKNEQKRCQIDAIRFDHCINFNTQKEAIVADYDFCAYCFSKEKSKR